MGKCPQAGGAWHIPRTEGAVNKKMQGIPLNILSGGVFIILEETVKGILKTKNERGDKPGKCLLFKY